MILLKFSKIQFVKVVSWFVDYESQIVTLIQILVLETGFLVQRHHSQETK